jgi:anti-sigma regulatory factor (Ser/Thr protein kinase)
MTPGVAVATDLDTFALVLTVTATDTEAGVLSAADRSAAQRPAAVVVDLTDQPHAPVQPELRRICARYAVPLLVTVALVAGAGGQPTFPDVAHALATLPHANLPAADRRTLSLEPAVTAPARARAAVGEAVAAWGLTDLSFPTELIISELVSNAVRHAAPPVDLLVRRTTSGLCVAVRDRNPVPPAAPVARPDAGALGGRGLYLIATTASRWGYLVGSADKVVWAMISPGGPATWAARAGR